MINFASLILQIMIKSKLVFSLIILMVINLNLFSQSNLELYSEGDILSKIQAQKQGQGEILIFQDMRINELIYNHIEQNKLKGGVSGYRIRIFSNLGSGARDQSQAAKARFYELFPQIPIYREYDSPYFKVYVGDYRTKVDALKDFNRIKRYFTSAFIVPDKINYPELDK
ncbi:SPOR domain-containing protein [Bacteroidota bacterium]